MPDKDSLTPSSLAEFYEQTVVFRELMGNRNVMLDEERRRSTARGYAIMFARARLSRPEEKKAFVIFEACMDEFGKRCVLIDALLAARSRADVGEDE